MFLGLDLGTTNVKALLVDADGRIVAEGSAPVQRFCTPDGGVEQDIEEIWTAACGAIRQAVSKQNPAQIRAVGISSQGGAMQLLDDQERPIGRVISWLDARGRPFDRDLTTKLGEAFFASHIGHSASGIAIGQILRLGQQAPEMLAKAKSIAFVGDVMVGRLCGRRAHDATSLSIAFLYNPWSGRADPDVLDRIAIREDHLPDLLPVTSPAGTLGREAAEATGLVAGIPVSAAIHDQYAGTLGAGSVAEGDVFVGTGTAWVLLANSGRLERPVTRQAIVCPHPIEGLYGQMMSMVNGGSAVEWVLRLLGRAEASRHEIDAMLESVPPGSDGLCFWPRLVPAVGSEPSPASGGRMAGITLAHTGNHLVRAVVEGLACELSRYLGLLISAGFPVRRLVMCGGAALGQVTPQIIADLMDRPVACATVSAVSAFGAATVARSLVEGGDLASLSRRLAPTSRTVEPGENAPTYRRLLQRYLGPQDPRSKI